MSSKKIIATIFFFSFVSLAISFSQENYITRKTASTKLNEAIDKSKKEFREGDLKAAIKTLDKVIEKEPTFIDAFFQKAIIYNYVKKYADAEIAFEKALAISATYEPEAYYSLAEVEVLQGKNDEAIAHYEALLKSKSTNVEGLKKAREKVNTLKFTAEAMKNPVAFTPIKLSESINTDAQEYFPCITADGESLIFTRRGKTGEDFYFSKKENDKWAEATAITTLNTLGNEGGQSISADGRTIVYTACGRPGGYGDCDLYFSEYTNGKWTTTKNMGANVNSRVWDSHPALSADGRIVYFSSSRSGGLGLADIWFTERQNDGSWSVVKNLGAPINTENDDVFPFIHQDGQTFYYASNGYPGMGGKDLFFTRKDEKNEWLTPKNMGYPINSAADETGLVVSLDGKKAYFASSDRSTEATKTDAPSRFAFENIDIFSFDLYQEAQPKAVTYVKGNVFDVKNNQKLRAKAEIIDLATQKIVSTIISDEKGEFLICLTSGKNYALNVYRKNYSFYSDNFSLGEELQVAKPYNLDIPLIPLEKTVVTTTTPTVTEKPIVLKNIFFETGSAKLKNESILELNMLKNLLTENPTLKIQINGHTDNVGNDADNMSLSNNRAKAVFDFLIQQKIESNRLIFKGFGESTPIATNDTPEGRQQNRRTEYQIIAY
jgi:outer membrane protein OmpA-like peptidoglycan-associated protein/tetratricopeptide (TPR) repeat protein